MKGYYNNPEATAKAINADGWLRTGDLGVLTRRRPPAHVGPLKDMFRVGGENVAPAEVEEVLLDASGDRNCAGGRRSRCAPERSAGAYVMLKPGAALRRRPTDRLDEGALRELRGAALREGSSRNSTRSA